MPNVDYESYIIESGSPAMNSSVKTLDIQNKTGAHMIAVRRGNKTILGLSSDFIFQKGDIIFLIGDKSSLENANRLFFADTST
jgi:CPA2 family monovalent cation:H+ antiporter-2